MSAKRMPITTLEDLKQAIDEVVLYNWDDELADYSFNCSDEPGDNQRSEHILHTLLALRNWTSGTTHTIDDVLLDTDEVDDLEDLDGTIG